MSSGGFFVLFSLLRYQMQTLGFKCNEVHLGEGDLSFDGRFSGSVELFFYFSSFYFALKKKLVPGQSKSFVMKLKAFSFNSNLL